MNIVDWAVETMNSLGAFGVFLLIFAENQIGRASCRERV